MLATFFLVLMLPAAGEPISLHPENPHYLLFRGKPTVLISSTEHYGAVLNGDFDAIPYLDELHARGLNLTRTFSGTYREVPGSFKIENNTSAMPARRINTSAPGREPKPRARSRRRQQVRSHSLERRVFRTPQELCRGRLGPRDRRRIRTFLPLL